MRERGKGGKGEEAKELKVGTDTSGKIQRRRPLIWQRRRGGGTEGGTDLEGEAVKELEPRQLLGFTNTSSAYPFLHGDETGGWHVHREKPCFHQVTNKTFGWIFSWKETRYYHSSVLGHLQHHSNLQVKAEGTVHNRQVIHHTIVWPRKKVRLKIAQYYRNSIHHSILLHLYGSDMRQVCNVTCDSVYKLMCTVHVTGQFTLFPYSSCQTVLSTYTHRDIQHTVVTGKARQLTV